VHLFQARDVPAMDSNGLCDPYVRVKVMGREQKTKVIKKTLFPQWYQTLVFDDITIQDADDFAFATQVVLRVFDHDTPPVPDEYIATALIPFSDALKTDDPYIETFPDPNFYPLMKELPNDTQGKKEKH
jgi:Ca2+-dependent lipid-binding protein